MDAADRKRKWDEQIGGESPAPTSESGATSTQPDAAAASEAAAIAAKITASIRGPPVQGNELIRLGLAEEGYIKDIPINELKNRYVLTRGASQKEVRRALFLLYG